MTTVRPSSSWQRAWRRLSSERLAALGDEGFDVGAGQRVVDGDIRLVELIGLRLHGSGGHRVHLLSDVEMKFRLNAKRRALP